MNEVAVITVSTAPPTAPGTGYFALYMDQLEAAGVDHHNDIVPVIPNMASGSNLGFKVETYRRLASEFMDYDLIVISDAFDVQFIGTKAGLLAKIPSDHILCAAEKNCYPEPSIAEMIEQLPSGFSYFNGGLAAGTPGNFLVWCDTIERHSEYDPLTLDQAFFNRRLSERWAPLVIDHETNLFFSTYLAWDDLDFVFGLPVNTRTGGHPSFLHFNNKSDRAELWERRDRSLL